MSVFHSSGLRARPDARFSPEIGARSFRQSKLGLEVRHSSVGERAIRFARTSATPLLRTGIEKPFQSGRPEKAYPLPGAFVYSLLRIAGECDREGPADANTGGRRSPLFAAAIRLGARVAGDFDVVVIAGDHLDLSSLVDWRAQSVVVRKYIELLESEDPADHLLRQPRPRFARRASARRWRAGSATCTARRCPSDGSRSLMVDDTLITICPWWDGPLVRADVARLAAEARRSARPLDLGPPCAARQVADELGRQPLFRRCRARANGSPRTSRTSSSPATSTSRPSSAAARGSTGSASTWVFNAGHQFGAPPAHIILDTDEAMALWFSAAGNQYVRLDQPLAAPGREAAPRCPTGSHSRGSGWRSDPGVNSGSCWWMRLSSTSSTMPRCGAAPRTAA